MWDKTNSADPDQTPQQKEASDQGLHCCLQITLVKFE